MAQDALGNLIFLSYRRADTAPHALALKLELETRLRAVQVFLDTHVIQAGDSWPAEIEEALGASKVIIPIIGRDWAGLADGKRRIDNPLDWVHREVKFALDRKRDALVPILVDRAPALRAEHLPPALSEFASVQPHNLDINDWDRGVSSLMKILSEKFAIEGKQARYKFPTPDETIAKTIPYPWKDLEAVVLRELTEWRVEFSDDPDRLHYKRVELVRDFEFRSFSSAIEFVDVAAKHAEEMDHHPRWMNLWKTVTVWLSTWDAGHRITVLDVSFARYLEKRYRSL